MREAETALPIESAEFSEALDLRQQVGFDWLESTYGHSPIELSKNAALVAVLLLDQTERVIIIGQDSGFMGEPSQTFLDRLLEAMADENNRSGYAQLFDSYASYLGGPQAPEYARQQLRDLVERKNRYLANFYELGYSAREQHQDELRHDISTLREAAISHLQKEQDHLDDLDQALLWEFQHRNDTPSYR